MFPLQIFTGAVSRMRRCAGPAVQPREDCKWALGLEDEEPERLDLRCIGRSQGSWRSGAAFKEGDMDAADHCLLADSVWANLTACALTRDISKR